MKTWSVSNSANQHISNFFADEANCEQFSKSASRMQIVSASLSCKQILLQTSVA
jgi:hypothetical protein